MQPVSIMFRRTGHRVSTTFRQEANAWRKYVSELAPVTLERTILVRVVVALRALETRAHARLESIDGTRPVRNGARKSVTRRAASSTRTRAHASQ